MILSRIEIRNFRNFQALDVSLGEHAVILGENRVGKTNLLFALQLLLDPSLPDSARRLRLDDFWDGLKRPLGTDDSIEISAEFRGFEGNENLLAVLADCLVKPDPMVARITYRYQPIALLEEPPKSEADYEFVIFGGERPDNIIGYELRRWMPMDLFPALRDAEADLARWSRSPFRPLLDRAAAEIDKDDLNAIAEEVEETTKRIAQLSDLAAVVDDINTQLIAMAGKHNAVDTALGFAPTDPEKLLRALQLMIDGGRRGVGDASLGTANILYLALKELEHQHLVDEGERQHTFLAIEEPEAHLHPHVQRLIYRNFLKARDEGDDDQQSRSIILTTHSPNVASVAPLRNIVVLKKATGGEHTIGRSLLDIDLESTVLNDLERYLDVTRGELFFAKGVILVEGDSERFLLPTLAKLHDLDLDALGISVCSVAGTNFAPYVQLLGPDGLDCPFVVLTDRDPVRADSHDEDSDEEDTDNDDNLGDRRVVNLMKYLIDEDEWDDLTYEQLLDRAPAMGIFMNTHTFEIDLFEEGASKEFEEAIGGLTTNKNMLMRFNALVEIPSTLHTNADEFLKDISAIGKGRFAQRLAAVLLEADVDMCPPYIANALDYLKAKLA